MGKTAKPTLPSPDELERAASGHFCKLCRYEREDAAIRPWLENVIDKWATTHQTTWATVTKGLSSYLSEMGTLNRFGRISYENVRNHAKRHMPEHFQRLADSGRMSRGDA